MSFQKFAAPYPDLTSIYRDQDNYDHPFQAEKYLTPHQKPKTNSTMASNDLYTRITHTAHAFAESYSQENCGRNITALSATLTPTCRRHFGPSSLLAQAPNLAAGQSNGEYEVQSKKELTSLFPSWKVEVVDLTVDERARKVVVRAATHADSRRGKTYHLENVFTLFLTQDGAKVEKVVQIVDVGAAGQLMQDEKEWAEGLQ